MPLRLKQVSFIGPKKNSRPMKHSKTNTNNRTVDRSLSNVILPLPTANTGNKFDTSQTLGFGIRDSSLKGNSPGLKTSEQDFQYNIGTVEGGWKSLTRPVKKKKLTEE